MGSGWSPGSPKFFQDLRGTSRANGRTSEDSFLTVRRHVPDAFSRLFEMPDPSSVTASRSEYQWSRGQEGDSFAPYTNSRELDQAGDRPSATQFAGSTERQQQPTPSAHVGCCEGPKRAQTRLGASAAIRIKLDNNLARTRVRAGARRLLFGPR